METRSVYEKSPWLSSYPKDVPKQIEIPTKSLNEMFSQIVEKFKDKTAVYFYGNKITYKELNEKIDRLATGLSELGLKKGDSCGMLVLNSPEYIISFFALAKIGVIIVPISPVYVSSEIRYQMEDSQAESIICQDMLYEGLEKTGLKLKRVILVSIEESLPTIKRFVGKSILREVYQKMAVPDLNIYKQEGFYQLRDLIKQYPARPSKVSIDPREDILTLHYTGGTTGTPKGVMLTHFNTIAGQIQFRSFYPEFCREGREVLMGYMPFYHQGGQCQALLRSTLNGNCIVVITNPEIDDIINLTIRCRATSFVGSPSIYEMLKDYKKTSRVNWKGLKAVMAGGDALSEYTQKDWEARTGVNLLDIWGMTECSDLNIGNPLGKRKMGSIGIPFPNVKAAILDPDKDEFIPVMELGELAISSPSVTSKGYWRKPEASKDCESLIGGTRWWRTGDLAKMDEDGYFFIYDRKRDLIKYKGLRVYAREVEEVLRMHPKIKEAGVIGVKDVRVGENVKAYVVLESDARGQLSEEDIINHCQGKLTHYKIPRIVEFVGEIPKTDMGKVSRRDIRDSEGE